MSSRLPGVEASIILNPLLTSGITSVRKPVILGVGDVKVLISNEKFVRGNVLGGVDIPTNTIYGSSDAERLANIIRIGNTPNSADYVKTTNYIITNGNIDWSPGPEVTYPSSGYDEPATGQEFYVTYYKSISNYTLTEYMSEGDIKSAYGDITFAEYNQYATVTAVASGTPTTTFSWANLESIDTPITDWSISFISGPNTGVTRSVSSYTSPQFVVSVAFPNSVSIGDIFLVKSATAKANMLTMGALAALRNGAQSVVVGQFDNTSWSDKLVPTEAQYSVAISTHLETLKARVDFPYYIVPMLPDNAVTFVTNSNAQTSAINLVWNHCKLMSASENKGERTCVAGFLSGTTTDNFKSYAAAYFSQRMVIIAPSELGFSDLSTKTLNGSIGAAAWAGRFCSKTDYRSMLQESLTSIIVKTNFYNAIQQRDLTAKGVSFLISDSGVVKVVASKTTDTSTADTEDVAVVAIADHLKKTTREELAGTFIGQPISSRLVGAIGGRMSSIFERLILEQVIETYKASSITVRQSLQEPRLIEVTASVKPLYSLWWINISMDFYV